MSLTNFPLIRLLRPHQWIKNGFIFIPFIFSGKLTSLSLLFDGLLVFIAFCFISSSCYILNDLADVEFDRNHYEKKDRSIASGTISVSTAVILMLVMASVAVVIAFLQSKITGGIILFYAVLNIIYSLYLKNIVILDIFSIALSFLLRVLGGAYACTVPPSHWIILMTFSLALLLAVGKRRVDLLTLSGHSKSHRKVLSSYSLYTVDQMIVVLMAMIIITFSLFTVSNYAIERFGTDALVFTVPFVIYGLFRYLYIVNDKGSIGDPTSILFTDKHILLCVLGWLITCIWILYK